MVANLLCYCWFCARADKPSSETPADTTAIASYLSCLELTCRSRYTRLNPYLTHSELQLPPVCPGDMSAWLIPVLSLCRFHSSPSSAVLAAPELQVSAMSKGDKQLLKVKISFANAILPKMLSPLPHVKEGHYGRYDTCNVLLPQEIRNDCIELVQSGKTWGVPKPRYCKKPNDLGSSLFQASSFTTFSL